MSIEGFGGEEGTDYEMIDAARAASAHVRALQVGDIKAPGAGQRRGSGEQSWDGGMIVGSPQDSARDQSCQSSIGKDGA
jgi:hypothetical protein